MNTKLLLIALIPILLINIANAINAPINVISYYNVSLNNSVGNPALGNFTQNITFNGLTNNTLLNGNASNVIFFYANGTIIPSWFEGNVSNEDQNKAFNTSSNLMWWLNLTNGTGVSIASNTIIYVYMGFGNMTTSFFNGYTVGEAPQIWCSSGCAATVYGEYDNGAYVFPYYENWTGGSLASGWLGNGYIQNNGISVTSRIYTDSQFTLSNFTLASLGYATGYASSTDIIGYSDEATYTIGIDGDSGTSKYAVNGNSNISDIASGSTSSVQVLSFWTNATYAFGTLNYNNQAESLLSGISSTHYIDICGSGVCGGGANVYSQWVRETYTPPDNTMPIQSFGALITVPFLSLAEKGCSIFYFNNTNCTSNFYIYNNTDGANFTLWLNINYTGWFLINSTISTSNTTLSNNQSQVGIYYYQLNSTQTTLAESWEYIINPSAITSVNNLTGAVKINGIGNSSIVTQGQNINVNTAYNFTNPLYWNGTNVLLNYSIPLGIVNNDLTLLYQSPLYLNGTYLGVNISNISSGVTSINGLTGIISLLGGNNVDIYNSSNAITINSTASGGGSSSANYTDIGTAIIIAFISLAFSLLFLGSQTKSRAFRICFVVGGLLVFYGVLAQVGILGAGYTIPSGVTSTYYNTTSVHSTTSLTYNYDFVVWIVIALYLALEILAAIGKWIALMNFNKAKKADVNVIDE